MNYQAIIAAIQLETLNDPTPPTTGSQEFLMYSQLIAYLAIPTWENERGVLWQELMVPDASAGTLSAGTPTANSITLPTNFKSMYDSQVVLTFTAGNQQVYTIKPQNQQAFNPYQQVREFYVTGNPSAGYKLVPGWTIGATDPEVGATVSFNYYKHATLPTLDSTGNITNLTAVPEMSDPSFISYKVAAQVAAANYNTAMFQVLEDKANYAMKNMRSANSINANYQDHYIKDVDHLLRHQGQSRNPHITPNGSFGIN